MRVIENYTNIYSQTLQLPGTPEAHLRAASSVQDVDEIMSILREYSEHLGAHDSWAQSLTNKHALANYIADIEYKREKDWAMQYRVIDGPQGANGPIIGDVVLFNRDELANDAEVGVWVIPTHEGKGYMSRAVTKILDYGRECWGIEQANASISVLNGRSERLFGRLGFSIIGVPFEDSYWWSRDGEDQPRVMNTWSKPL
jgi:RimJ/RimL family protein N-acetyltransferase